MRFAYFSRATSGKESLVDIWNLANEMPAAVRVAMMNPNTGRIIMSIRIPLMIDAESGCAAPSVARCSYVDNGEADALGAEDIPRELLDRMIRGVG